MAPKKSAKKTPGKHDQDKAARDARRAYEHLGRVRALASLAAAEQDSISILVSTADDAFRADHFKDSADLLRAAEHLCFGSAIQSVVSGLSTELIASIQDELQHLRSSAEEHASDGDLPAAIQKIYTRMWKESESALRQASYGRALELARGAEALSHVRYSEGRKLAPGEPPKRLQGSR